MSSDDSRVVKLNSAHGYLSLVRAHLIDFFPAGELDDAVWYKRIRTDLEKVYISRCIQRGESFVDRARPIPKSVLNDIGKNMFE
jgi:hypothetical protein